MDTNFRVLFYCQRCKKEHDRTNDSFVETSVLCSNPDCFGYVVTPTGKANIKVVVDAKLYVIVGSEFTAWIGAMNREEAIGHFVDAVDPIVRNIKVMSDEETQDRYFVYNANPLAQTEEEEEIVQVSGKDALAYAHELPIVFYQIDNEELKKIQREEEGEGGL